MKFRICSLLLGLLTFLNLGLVNASAFDGVIDEARFGGSIIDPNFRGNSPALEYDRIGVTGEVLFAPFDFDYREQPEEGFIHELLTPRFHLGALVSIDDHVANSIYAGLTWHHKVYGPVFVETSLDLSRINSASCSRLTRFSFKFDGRHSSYC